MKMRITAFQSGDASLAPGGLVEANDPAALIRAARDKAALVVVDQGKRLAELRDLVAEVESALATDQAVVDRLDAWLAAHAGPGAEAEPSAAVPSAALDQKALAVARHLADIAADQSNPGQALARMQCVVLDAMRWVGGQSA